MGLGVIKYYLKNGVSLLNQFEVIFPILEIPLSIDKNSDFFSYSAFVKTINALKNNVI